MDIFQRSAHDLVRTGALDPHGVANSNVDAILASFTAQFGVAFTSFAIMDTRGLAARGAQSVVDRSLYIISHSDPAVRPHFQTMKKLANTLELSSAQRMEYVQALDAIYATMQQELKRQLSEHDTLLVCPEREGRLLAHRYGYFIASASSAPHAKRAPFGSEMLVGLTPILGSQGKTRLVILDGAIASGATIIAILAHMHQAIRQVHIYSAHAAEEGLRAIFGYSAEVKLDTFITVGHVSGVLNKKRYAVDVGDPDTVVVGDLGDIISPVLNGTSAR